jgi:hypothetical protein
MDSIDCYIRQSLLSICIAQLQGGGGKQPAYVFLLSNEKIQMLTFHSLKDAIIKPQNTDSDMVVTITVSLLYYSALLNLKRKIIWKLIPFLVLEKNSI